MDQESENSIFATDSCTVSRKLSASMNDHDSEYTKKSTQMSSCLDSTHFPCVYCTVRQPKMPSYRMEQDEQNKECALYSQRRKSCKRRRREALSNTHSPHDLFRTTHSVPSTPLIQHCPVFPGNKTVLVKTHIPRTHTSRLYLHGHRCSDHFLPDDSANSDSGHK